MNMQPSISVYDGTPLPSRQACDGTVSELRPVHQIDPDLVRQWQALATNVSEPNIFYEPALLLPALEQFERGRRVRLFLLWESEAGASQLRGMLPVLPSWQLDRWCVPHVQNWMHQNCFLGTPLVAKGWEECFWESFFAELDKSSWDGFLHINGLTINGPLDRAMRSVCADQKRSCDLVHSEARAMLTGSGDPDDYLEAQLRGKKRKELRRQKKRLGEEGDLQFSRLSDGSGLAEWTEEFLALEARGWKGEAGSALNSDAATADFFRDALRGASDAGRLERLDYRLNGQPIAMLVNFQCAPGSFSFKTAFDEAYARYSPGVLLQLENLEILRRDDIDWMDSCAAQDHPMIDHIWAERRHVGRFSIALSGVARQTVFHGFRFGENIMARIRKRKVLDIANQQENEDGGSL